MAASVRSRAARWRNLGHLPPFPLAPDALGRLFKLLGKLAPTAVLFIGVMRRARRQRFPGVQFAVADWARAGGVVERTAQRSLRLLTRLKIFRAVEQWVESPWRDGAGKLHLRYQVATVYVFGDVGRFLCDTRPPKPATRRAFRELVRPSRTGQNVTPSAEETPTESLPQSSLSAPTVLAFARPGPEAPPEQEQEGVACGDGDDPLAGRLAQSNAPPTPTGDGVAREPWRARWAMEEEVPRALAPPGAPPLSAWAALCPGLFPEAQHSTQPEKPAPARTGRARRGGS